MISLYQFQAICPLLVKWVETSRRGIALVILYTATVLATARLTTIVLVKWGQSGGNGRVDPTVLVLRCSFLDCGVIVQVDQCDNQISDQKIALYVVIMLSRTLIRNRKSELNSFTINLIIFWF